MNMKLRSFSLDELEVLQYGLDENEFVSIDVHAKVKTSINSTATLSFLKTKRVVRDIFIDGEIKYQILAWRKQDEQQLRKKIGEEKISYKWIADKDVVKNSGECDQAYFTQGMHTQISFEYIFPYELAYAAVCRKRWIQKEYSPLQVIPRYVFVNGKKIMGEEYSLDGYIVRDTNLAKVRLGMMGTCVVPLKGLF